MYKVISFYRYIPIEQPEVLREVLTDFCQSRHIFGRILVANEGINGAVCGLISQITQFQEYLMQNPLFTNMTFREQTAEKNTYHKLVVRVRKEIVHFGSPVTFNHPGTHLEPSQLQQWYNTNQDFIIIDARNDYEYDLGRFKNAIKLPIQNFREFPSTLPQLQQYKEKKIVLYCTGGIRCEKASAYLKDHGFDQVYQIQGGIINYVNQYPNTQEKTSSSGDSFKTYWQGGLFVFDDRLSSDVGPTITQCRHCHTPEKQYLNCHNIACDKLFIACRECQSRFNHCCSQDCANSPHQRKIKPSYKLIGIVENYYPKAQVALVRIKQETLPLPTTLTIKGKTTPALTLSLSQVLDETGIPLHTLSPGIRVTFSVSEKVRKNDSLLQIM